MKAASADLIEFLDSDASRHMVMWEEFNFTLTNGSTLLYTNRDPDCALPPAPPPPSDATLLDTFAGSGNMATHVGESGANWPSVNDLGVLADIQVESNSIFSDVPGFDSLPIFATWHPSSAVSDMRMTATCVVPGVGSYLYLGTTEDIAYNTSASCYTYVDNAANLSGPTVFVFASIYGATSSATDSFEANRDPGSSMTMALQLNFERDTLRVLVDGECRTELALDPGDSLLPQDLAYFRMSGQALMSLIEGNHYTPDPFIFLYDSFTAPRDGATLGNHIGEVNAVWSVQSFFGGGGPSLDAAAMLNGGHFLHMEGNGSLQQFYTPSGLPQDGTNFFLQIATSIFADATGNAALGLLTADGDMVRFGITANGSATSVFARLQPNSGENQVAASSVVTGSTTVRLEVTNNRRTMEVIYTGGITLLSHTFNTPLGTPESVYLQLGNVGGNLSRGVDQVIGGYI